MTTDEKLTYMFVNNLAKDNTLRALEGAMKTLDNEIISIAERLKKIELCTQLAWKISDAQKVSHINAHPNVK